MLCRFLVLCGERAIGGKKKNALYSAELLGKQIDHKPKRNVAIALKAYRIEWLPLKLGTQESLTWKGHLHSLEVGVGVWEGEKSGERN